MRTLKNKTIILFRVVTTQQTRLSGHGWINFFPSCTGVPNRVQKKSISVSVSPCLWNIAGLHSVFSMYHFHRTRGSRGGNSDAIFSEQVFLSVTLMSCTTSTRGRVRFLFELLRDYDKIAFHPIVYRKTERLIWRFFHVFR